MAWFAPREAKAGEHNSAHESVGNKAGRDPSQRTVLALTHPLKLTH